MSDFEKLEYWTALARGDTARMKYWDTVRQFVAVTGADPRTAMEFAHNNRVGRPDNAPVPRATAL
jgi:hypothetical protein